MIDDDLLTGDAIRDPYPVFGQLRDEDPVHWNERYRSWFVTRHDDVSAAFRDERFSSDRISGFVRAKLRNDTLSPELRRTLEVLQRWMVFHDPPEHTRLRRLVHRAFTPRAVESMRGRVERIAHQLLDDVEAHGEADLVSAFAFPIPAIVIAEMLGVPAGDRDRFKTWSDQLTSLVFGNFDDPERYERASLGMAELTDYLDGLVAAAEAEPREDLISALIRARDEGDALTHDEVIATCTLLLFGGHETTTNLIANGIHQLIRHPDQQRLFRDREVDARSVVEEVLRFDGPAKTVVRQVSEEIELRGRHLAPGERVFLVPPSANRDPNVFDDPDDFDLTRESTNHVGFGLGIHYCLGAPLARLEAGEALTAVFDRFGDLEHAAEELSWHPVLLSRGLEKLPVRFRTTGPASKPTPSGPSGSTAGSRW